MKTAFIIPALLLSGCSFYLQPGDHNYCTGELINSLGELHTTLEESKKLCGDVVSLSASHGDSNDD